MNNLQTIKEQELLGKEFRVYGTLEKPLFLAKDVAEWIEHSNVSTMLSNIEAEEKELIQIGTLNNAYSAWFLTEDGLYEVLMQSRKQIAKQFKKEVKKILKEIRKTGGYIHSTSDMSDDEIMARALQVAQRKIESKNRELEEKNRFINQIASSKNSLLV
ncbi:BRO-N domain-containing protein, partial [Clostridioides difficile]